MVYKDGHNNDFRLACGDQIITSYKQRASLMFAFNLRFRNKFERQTFSTKIGGKYAGIGSISGDIQKIAKENNIEGTIDLQVYQIGGDPRKVA